MEASVSTDNDEQFSEEFSACARVRRDSYAGWLHWRSSNRRIERRDVPAVDREIARGHMGICQSPRIQRSGIGWGQDALAGIARERVGDSHVPSQQGSIARAAGAADLVSRVVTLFVIRRTDS